MCIHAQEDNTYITCFEAVPWPDLYTDHDARDIDMGI